MMRAMSGLGDAALLLPACLLLVGALLVARRVRAALLWSAATVLCGLATLAAKLLFHACGAAISDLDVISPSGHASFACIFYGGLAVMVGVGRPVLARAVLAIGCIGLLGLIGTSRVATGAHSAEEVVLGLAIGVASTALFAVIYVRTASAPLPVLPLALGFAIALALLGGRHFSLEPMIGRAARRIATTVDVCRDSALGRELDRRHRLGVIVVR